jgi:hypothetical protein
MCRPEAATFGERGLLLPPGKKILLPANVKTGEIFLGCLSLRSSIFSTA